MAVQGEGKQAPVQLNKEASGKVTKLRTPVLESMRAREPGLQAPSNLAGSKMKNTHFFPLINSFSEI